MDDWNNAASFQCTTNVFTVLYLLSEKLREGRTLGRAETGGNNNNNNNNDDDGLLIQHDNRTQLHE